MSAYPGSRRMAAIGSFAEGERAASSELSNDANESARTPRALSVVPGVRGRDPRAHRSANHRKEIRRRCVAVGVLVATMASVIAKKAAIRPRRSSGIPELEAVNARTRA